MWSPGTILRRAGALAPRAKMPRAASSSWRISSTLRSPWARTGEIQYERELVGSSGQFDEVGQPGLNGGWTERAALRARQQLLGKLAEIAMREIDLMDHVVGGSGDLLNRVDQCRPTYIERTGIGEREWPAGEENGRGAEIILAEAAQIVREKCDFPQFGRRARDGFGRLCEVIHKKSEPRISRITRMARN